MSKPKKPAANSGTIALNKKAKHDYFIEQRFEAGIALTGWEVKSLRAGKAQLTDSYVLLKDGEAYLIGSHITPLGTVSTHYVTDPGRTRKLLLHREEIDKIERRVNEKGLTVVPLSLYFKDGRAKVEIALARGKKSWDKRQSIAERTAKREVEVEVGRRLKGMRD